MVYSNEPRNRNNLSTIYNQAIKIVLELWTCDSPILFSEFVVVVSGSGDEEVDVKKEAWSSGVGGGLYVDEFMDFDAPFNCRLSLKDFDTLIRDLDRELAKQINICL